MKLYHYSLVNHFIEFFLLFFLIFLLGISPKAQAADFNITSPAFSENEKIPPLYSCDGKNISPELNWINPPNNTQSFVLILSSPDWTTGKVYLWILYNIPPNLTGLAEKANEELPSGLLVGNNYYFETSYRGPCPPDHVVHHYVFTLYALDTMIDLPGGAEIDEVFNKIDKHVLQKTSLTGVFSH